MRRGAAMLSADLLRRDPDAIRRSLERRREDASVVNELVALDARRRDALVQVEGLRSRRNEASKQIGELMKRGGGAEADARREEVRELGERLGALENEERELAESLRRLMLTLPNLVSGDVPDGDDAEGNVVTREEGERREYDFELKPHWELSESLGITR